MLTGRNLKIILGTCILLGLVYYLWPHSLSLVAKLGVFNLFIALMLTIIPHPLLFIFRMKSALHQIFKQEVTFSSLLKIEIISKFLYSTFIPKAYLPLKAIFLRKLAKVPTKITIAYLAIEFAVDNLLVMIISVVGVFTVLKDSKFYYELAPQLRLLMMLGTIAAVCFVIFWMVVRKSSTGTLTKRKSGIFVFLEKVVDKIEKGFRLLITSKQASLNFAFLTLIKLLINCYKLYFLFQVLGNGISFTQVLVVYSVTGIISMITMVPGGLGITEITGTALFFYFGVPYENALFVMILDRILVHGSIAAAAIYLFSSHTFEYSKIKEMIKPPSVRSSIE